MEVPETNDNQNTNDKKSTTNLNNEYNDDKLALSSNIEDNEVDRSHFSGVVNYTFKREGYCVNKYQNHDHYFGYYSNDLRNGCGFYTYCPHKKGINVIREYYYGYWKNDHREENGIYLWLIGNNKNTPLDNFDESNFHAYIGGFKNDLFTKGTFICKEKNNYLIYYGTFSERNQRQGKNCFYYSANLEQLCYGIFKNNIFSCGYVGKFSNEGELISVIKYKKNEIIEKNEKTQTEIEKISKILITFRNVVKSKDYFGILYDTFGKALDFKKKYVNNIDILNEEKYDDLVSICSAYKKVSITRDIEKHFKDKKKE